MRKAGGVYYTPKYVVDYIVQNTVGKLIKGKTPKYVEKIKICDPACGSGSFLIGAYQHLLYWHLQYYTDNPPKKKKNYPLTPDGNLTTAEKKRILLNNIFGVDIDAQAVEVTKLNLLLKALEGETQASISQQMQLFHERVLPNLGSNIKCGNSLIGPDFYDNQLDLFPEQIKKINAFGWKQGFSEIFKTNGFNAIIGNPPWGATLSDEELAYLRKKHRSIIVRMIDTYMYFVHKSGELLNQRGLFGMIIPSTILNQTDMKLLRKHLVENYDIQVVINLGEKVFGPKVLNTSTILTFAKSKANINGDIIVGDVRNIDPEERSNVIANITVTPKKDWIELVSSDNLKTYFTFDIPGVKMLTRLSKRFIPFKDVIHNKIQRGISPDYSQAFLISNETAKAEKIEPEILKPVVLGKHITRYGSLNSDESIIYLTKNDDIEQYPNAKKHLSQFRNKITCREVKEGKHPWYSLHRPRNPEIFHSPKFIGLTTSRTICIALDEQGNYATDALYLFSLKVQLKLNPHFVLGVLHSKSFQFLYHVAFQGGQRVIPQIKAANLYELPFPILRNGNVDNTTTTSIAKYVQNLFQLNQHLQSTKLDTKRQQIQRTIDHTERKIDELVYRLYGLTKEEIETIENT